MGRAEQDRPGRQSGPCGWCWGTFLGQKSHWLPSLGWGFRAALSGGLRRAGCLSDLLPGLNSRQVCATISTTGAAQWGDS